MIWQYLIYFLFSILFISSENPKSAIYRLIWKGKKAKVNYFSLTWKGLEFGEFTE